MADALSRSFPEDTEATTNDNQGAEDNVSKDVCTISMASPLDAASIAEAQAADDELAELIDSDTSKLQCLEIDGHALYCDVSKNIVRPYLPKQLRRTAFDVIHGLAHPGGRATIRAMTDKFVWPGIKRDTRIWARCCEACQLQKTSRHNRSHFGKFTEPDNRFEHLHIDIIKMPLVGGMQYCLTIIDRFTRWPMAIPLANVTANTVAKALTDHWISIFGTPLFITSDRGAQFESALFKELAVVLGIKLVHTISYHPQSNGMVERFHRTLKAALRCCTQPWLDALPMVMLGLRTIVKEDLQASPSEMLFGTTPCIPGEFFTTNSLQANSSSFVHSLRQLFRSIRPVPASRHASVNPFVYNDLATCTHVFKRVESIRKPLEPPYTGPHRVLRRISERVYSIDINGVEKAISTDQLKPAYLEEAEDEQPQPALTNSQPSQPDAGPTPTPPQATSSASQAETPSRPVSRDSNRHVSFPAETEPVTGRGVIVAAPSSVPAPPAPGSRRKQALIPRDIFSLSHSHSCGEERGAACSPARTLPPVQASSCLVPVT